MHYRGWLVVIGINALAVGADDPPLVAPKEVTRSKWESIVSEIRERRSTTVEKIRALQSVARLTVIVERAKILDIRPRERDVDGDLLITCCGIYGGEPRQGFIVPKAKAHAIAGWSRWDRVSWLMRLRAHDLERIDQEIIYLGPKSLRRQQNPGITYSKIATTTRSYDQWRRAFASYVRKREWHNAWALIERVRGKAFAEPGAVTVKARGTITVQLRNGTKHILKVTDPQVYEAIDTKSKVVVGGFVEPNADDSRSLAADRGRFSLRLEFLRID